MHHAAVTLGCRIAGTAAAVGLLTAPSAIAHTSHANKKSVDIAFAAVAGESPVACGTAIGDLGTAKTSAQLADLRFYVSDVALIRGNGKSVPVTLR